MACLEALGLPITPRRKTPPTVLLLLWALWCRDLRLPQCLRPGEEIWTHYQGSPPPPLHLDALLKLLSMCIVGYIGYLLLMIRLVGLPENGFLEASYLLSMTSNLYTTQLGPHIPVPIGTSDSCSNSISSTASFSSVALGM